MSAGVPWSVSAVDPDTWDAARDAARREGLSVGEWLEVAIRENSRNNNGRGKNPVTNFDQRLDDLAEQINMLAKRNVHSRPNAPVPYRDPQNDQIVASLEGLTERIDLMLAGIERAERSQGREEIGAAIRRLDSRIESILTERPAARTQDSEVDSKLDEMARVITQMSERLERETAIAAAAPAAPAPTADELDSAVAEILERQSMLDGTPMRRAPARATAPAAQAPAHTPNPQFAAFEQQLKTIANEMQSIRTANAAARNTFEPLNELRREISELARSMTELAPRRTLESLEQTVDALVRKIDRAALNTQKDNRSAQAVLNALEDIRGALSNVRPAESFISVEGDLNALSDKLDVINAKSVDGTTIARIQNQIQEVRDLMSNALPAESLQAVVAQIETIAGKVERISAPDDSGVRDIVSALEQRIDSLAERVEFGAQAAHAAQNPEAFDRIHQRLDSLQTTLDKTDGPAPMRLEETMRSVVERLDASEAKLANLGAIERGISDLSSQFDKARANAMDVAERAAKTALRELQAARQTMPQQVAAAQQAPLAPELPAQKPLAGEAMPHRSVTMVAPADTQPRFTRTPPVTVRSKDEFIATDGLPADYPLEPGSGAPRSRPAPAQQRIAQSEAAVADIAPRTADTPVKASDFIAAARRAAQAAAAEPNESSAGGKKKGALAGLFSRSRRAQPAAPSPAAVPAPVAAPALAPAEVPIEAEPKAVAASGGAGRSRRVVLLGLVFVMLTFSVVRLFDVNLLSPFIGGSETVPATAAPEKQTPPAKQSAVPQTNIVPPEVQQRSMLPGFIDPTASLAPASGVIAPQRTTSLFSAVPDDALTTQSTPQAPKQAPVQPAAAKTEAPVQQASVSATLPQSVTNELPASIGTNALRQAALNGDPAAAFEIGERFLNGTGVLVDMPAAVKWFERAVAKGSPTAAFRLGMAYEKGQGAPKDRGRARTNYVLAAESGHLKAMHNLAVMIVEDSGPSGKPDYANAIPWFRRAADRGLRDSQYNLGVLYARGLGVSQNLAESYRWFSLAANQGDPDAAKKRDDVASRLDQQTLVATRLAVQTWQPQASDESVNNPPLKQEWHNLAAAPKKRQKK